MLGGGRGSVAALTTTPFYPPRLDYHHDGDQQYSCGYFESPDQSLDDAQLAKKRHLAAKLRLQPGASVLDIGCGWGGLALYVAGMTGARVTGITLSQEQFRRSQNRALE